MLTEVLPYAMQPWRASKRPCESAWDRAEHVVRSMLCMNLRHQLASVAPVEWETGIQLLEDDDPAAQRLGTRLLLQVLAGASNRAAPAAAQILAAL